MNTPNRPESYVAKQSGPGSVAIHQGSNGQYLRTVLLPSGGKAVVNGSTLEVRKSSGQIELYELPTGRYLRTL
jgi:hypothetical protein